MVKIETRCRIPIRRTFGRIPWHVIPEPPATLQGVRIPSAILKIVFRHILFLPAGLYVAQPCRYCFAQRSKNGFFAPQGRHVAPINVKFGRSAPPYQISRLSGQRGEQPIFGPLSKNNTGMAALRAGLPVKIWCKTIVAVRSPVPNFTFIRAEMWEYSPQNCKNFEFCP